MKDDSVRFRCSEEFKRNLEALAIRNKRKVSDYIVTKFDEEIETMKKEGRKVLNKAKRIDEYGSHRTLPNVEIGEIVALSEIWDGEGETPEDYYSYLIKGDHQGGDYISYSFRYLDEDAKRDLDSQIQVTDIEIV